MDHRFGYVLALGLAEDNVPELPGSGPGIGLVDRKREHVSRPVTIAELEVQLVDALFVDQLDRKVTVFDADLGKRRQNSRPENGRHVLQFDAHCVASRSAC